MTKDMLVQVAACTTATSAWSMVEGMFSSMTRARCINTRLSLITLKKGDMTVANYVGKMRALADELAVTGKVVDDDDLISYIIAGLDEDYEPVIQSIVGRPDQVSVGEAFAQLLSFEHRLLLHRGEESQASANSASHGCGPRGTGSNNVTSNNCTHGGNFTNSSSRGGRGRGNPSGGRGSPAIIDNRPKCQLCYKRGYTVKDCWYRYNENFVPDERFAGSAASYGVDTNWYLDTGTTDHVTGDLEKLTVRDKYHGNDQIHTSGAGMEISHIGNSVVKTPIRNLYLNNILYAPKASKNLVSAYRLTCDNFVFIELYRKFFCIEDLATKRTLLRGSMS